ncbi:uncharacterized protein H6S33_004868 [Morchella sextelata]|uniref:uncharacterized protein n=1 Tax=Morchella sextelata TaxID=1174677 RepID=UPI001D04BC10|nr:uncharacterized protein H6S33_004868 [Morchella sextelata]KAH0605646.1 hypothetical protein H6S33_004868 [Morchella sextelata]
MADLALGIPGLVVLCIQAGQRILEKCRTFKNYETELADLSLNAEAQWRQLEEKIEFIAIIESSLEPGDRDHYERVITTLRGKLDDIRARIDSIPEKASGFLTKLRSAFRAGKGGFRKLKLAIKEFMELHQILLPSFYLLARVHGNEVEQRIKDGPAKNSASISTVKSLRKARADLELTGGGGRSASPGTEERMKQTKKDINNAVKYGGADNTYWTDRGSIKFTPVQTHESRETNRMVLIDSIPCDGRDRGAVNVIKDLQGLALVLQAIKDPLTLGMLSCAGITKVYGKDGRLVTSLEMVLEVPKELRNPRSFRSLLSGGAEIDFSISEKVNFAKQLARTVSFVHSANFVHKNFRPETIIVFDTRGTDYPRIGTPFLVGFQKFRVAVGGNTAKLGDTNWEKNIYRHPERQGEFPEEVYRMDHDVYSLGVCLLEIALWKSFVVYDEAGGNPRAHPEMERLTQMNGWDVRDELVKMAKELIPLRLGSMFMEVTVACLQGLGSSEMSPEISFIENILGKLNQITM